MTASQGLMLESASERLMDTVHAGSPTKHPARRMETIDAAGELRIPFTSGILVGIGESEDERVASLEAIAASHARHGHIQEVILQNFVPHPRYYGREVAEIADEAARERWSGDGSPLGSRGADARVGVGDLARGHEAAGRGDGAADARRRDSDPAEPLRLVGRARRGGRDRPRGASRPTATTSRPSTPSRARTRSESGLLRRAMRSPSACAPTPSTSIPSGWSRACSTR